MEANAFIMKDFTLIKVGITAAIDLALAICMTILLRLQITKFSG
jgi:hypothetical protein